MPNDPFLVAAYVVTWATLAGYTIYLFRLRRRARTQFEERVRPPKRDSVPAAARGETVGGNPR